MNPIISELPQDVVEKIAAGEVIERPASLVKELIENSLDAGATEIEVEFDHGGVDLIVTDNGHGIVHEQLPLALRRHTTSKISLAEDLWQLKSFGFRGEALASVAAVSELTVTSRVSGSAQAYRVQSSFGQVESTLETGFQEGTQVRVSRLFENVPARLKFLKSESAESSQIKKTLKAMALGHPSVLFRLKSRGELLAYWNKADSLRARAEQILGVKMFNAHNSGLNIAFASPHNVQRTSQDIWIFVQHRWIQDRALQAAVMESYRTLLMHGEYPMVVVDLQVNPWEVDVNVHPTKSQVKFQNPSSVFKHVHHTLRTGLESAPWIPKLQTSKETSSEVESISFREATQESFLSIPSEPPSNSKGENPEKEYSALEVKESSSVSDARKAYGATSFWQHLQVVGQVNLTYIAAQSRQGLYLVDQHAAHERVVFERLMDGYRKKNFEIQEFLIPISVEVEAEQMEAILKTQSELEELGLRVDAMGATTLAVRSAPALLQDRAVTAVIHEWAQEVSRGHKSFSLEKIVGQIFATMACHSVVRAGQTLGHEEMGALLKQMDESPLSAYCPHGRPVYMEYRFQDLDRSFGRIL